MTLEEKAAAIAVLDANIPSVQSVDSDGQYTEVTSYSPDGIHTIRLDQTVMPVRPSTNVGYCRYVSVPENGDEDLINVYADQFGSQPRRPIGWGSYRISDRS